MISKNEIKGKGKQLEGSIKATVGKLINDPDLEAKGDAERLEGKVQEKAGKAIRKVTETVEKVKEVVSGKR